MLMRRPLPPTYGAPVAQDEQLLTISEVAERLGMAPRTIRDWVSAKLIPSVRWLARTTPCLDRRSANTPEATQLGPHGCRARRTARHLSGGSQEPRRVAGDGLALARRRWTAVR
jgi:excisionase family DNA binding protein